jgi:tRNA threonylcarbamoyladenosine biosynthesis protein TsaE
MNIEVNSLDEMLEFGQKIGRLLTGGIFIELVGDVGAGKTTLVKGIATGLDITEPVQSPTFTISRLYNARDDIRLAHYDFYRLHISGIMSDEIDEMARDSRTVTIVEWGGAVADVLPTDRLTITITSHREEARQLVLTAEGDKSRKLHDFIT